MSIYRYELASENIKTLVINLELLPYLLPDFPNDFQR